MSTANSNLDLLEVESNDFGQLAQRINTFYSSDNSIKTTLSYTWERNQLMLDGKQWLMWSGDRQTGGQWKPLSVSTSNEYIPRPVTNYLFSIYQTLKAYLIKNKPRSEVKPNTQEYKDKVSSKIATLILECNWERLKEQYNYESAAASLLVYGTVFKKSYWDTTTINLVRVPKMVPQPITDPMTGAIVGMQEVQEVDPQTQQPVFIELPLGDVSTYVVDPFRIALDPLATHLSDCKWVMEYSIQTLDWIHQTYGKEGEGYTGLAAEVKEDTELNTSMRRWYQMKMSSGTKSGTLGATGGSGASDVMVEGSAVVKEYYERPSANYPKGRLIVVAGDKVLYSGESPYTGPEHGDWHPYSECRWEIVPGRFWGKSPFDDAVEIQKRINTIDSTVILSRKSMAFPQKLIPTSAGIANGEWTGRPGHHQFYKGDGSGMKPEIIPGQGPDASVFQERQQSVEDIKELTGAIDILRGDRPAGVNAASALSLLYEVGTGKLFPILDRWKQFVESDQKKQLRLTSKNYKEPRPDFVRALKAKNTDLLETDINNFIGSDLNDNCNVIVEAGSNIPKLQAAKQAMLIQAVQLGLLDLSNPENRIQLQEDLGISGFDAEMSTDIKRARWENDLMDNIQFSPSNKPIVLACDNHQLHLQEHYDRQKSPTFMSLPAAVQQAHIMHAQEHEQMQAMAMQAQMAQMAAMSPGPGAKGQQQAPQTPGGNPTQGPHQVSQSGNAHQGTLPAGVKNAIHGADLLNPATLEGRNS
jgi:hypothetical protein